jgi:flagellar basal body-associated protein FliL
LRKLYNEVGRKEPQVKKIIILYFSEYIQRFLENKFNNLEWSKN